MRLQTQAILYGVDALVNHDVTKLKLLFIYKVIVFFVCLWHLTTLTLHNSV